MKRTLTALTMIMCLTTFSYGFFNKETKKDVIATVGDESITLKELDFRIDAFSKQLGEQVIKREEKVKILNQIIDEKIIVQEAIKLGYEKNDEFKSQIELAKMQILIQMVIRDNIDQKIQISKEDLEDFYQKNIDKFKQQEQIRVRHILVKTKEEALAVLKKIQKGEDFIQLARTTSLDPSAANGGDIGWFIKGQLDPSFEKAAFELKVNGEQSGIVASKFGFHIIKLIDRNIRPQVTMTQAQKQIQQAVYGEMKSKMIAAYLEDLKKNYSITKDISKVK